MIFEFGNTVVESEKERNLYTKFFAGYFFNEIVAGSNTRLTNFAGLIKEKAISAGIPLKSDFTLSPEFTHVCFDTHAYLLGLTNEYYEEDRREIADILIHDRHNKVFISIEAKFLENFDVDDDVTLTLNRLRSIKDQMPDTQFIFCLLLSNIKWNRIQKMNNHPGSQYKKLIDGYSDKVLVLLWEELVNLCTDQRVSQFMNYQLSLVQLQRKSVRYKIQNGQPLRKTSSPYE